jgi:arsenate reductase
MITIYGIKNCDTMKKAFAWLDGQKLAYRFHDYKKAGVDRAQLTAWCAKAGWKTMVNTRGTTWRKLTPEQQTVSTQAGAVALMLENPSLIKRPVVEKGAQLLVGFDVQEYSQLLK